LAKKFAHIVFSVWLSILLLFGATPKEFIHNFANHKDTVDINIAKGLVLDKVHHHCSFISFNLMPFEDGFQPAFIPLTTTVFSVHQYALPISFIPRSINAVTLRGPPVV
jgi:hypothetical protein